MIVDGMEALQSRAWTEREVTPYIYGIQDPELVRMQRRASFETTAAIAGSRFPIGQQVAVDDGEFRFIGIVEAHTSRDGSVRIDIASTGKVLPTVPVDR